MLFPYSNNNIPDIDISYQSNGFEMEPSTFLSVPPEYTIRELITFHIERLDPDKWNRVASIKEGVAYRFDPDKWYRVITEYDTTMMRGISKRFKLTTYAQSNISNISPEFYNICKEKVKPITNLFPAEFIAYKSYGYTTLSNPSKSTFISKEKIAITSINYPADFVNYKEVEYSTIGTASNSTMLSVTKSPIIFLNINPQFVNTSGI
jgi:hypothetical protein